MQTMKTIMLFAITVLFFKSSTCFSQAGGSDSSLTDLDKASKQSPLIKVYPNPFRFTVHIDFTSDGKTKKTISVYDMRGSLLFTTFAAHSTRLNLKALVYGSYFITITDEDGEELYSGKLIRQ